MTKIVKSEIFPISIEPKTSLKNAAYASQIVYPLRASSRVIHYTE